MYHNLCGFRHVLTNYVTLYDGLGRIVGWQTPIAIHTIMKLVKVLPGSPPS